MALKIVVITLGVLIVALLAAVMWRIVMLAGGAGAGSIRAGGGVASRGFDPVTLGLPSGCRIMEANAGDGRLVLRIGEGAACDRVMLVDPASGRVLGTILP